MPQSDLVFVLRQPHGFDWQAEAAYSLTVQKRLLAAHDHVLQPPLVAERLLETESALLRLRSRTMSQRQQMLLFYLLAQCARARDLSISRHFCRALEWCSRAEQIAKALVDLGAQVDLHELNGTLHRAISIYWIAAEEFSYALRLLREHAENGESFDPEFEVTLASKTAALDYMLANFSRASEHLQRAEALLPLTAISVEGRGTVAWIFALLHRQRNELVEALRRIEEAARLYLQLGATNSTCRVLSLAADIALDTAESAGRDVGTASEDQFALAASYIEEAIRVGQIALDSEGLQIAELSHARLERLRSTAGTLDTEHRIRAVIRQARRMHDASLLTEALTSLGFDYLARGDTTAAKTWFKKAITTAANINAPGLAFLAQRGLRRANGRNV